ncbi:MAG: hypothetical protein J5599_09170, partial [Spirochaetales bacterium]|nr:hypothetical protein [Spirochaetales bacterium]
MRKVLVLLLAILMVFTIVACKQEPEQAEEPQATESEGKANLVSQGSKSGAKAIDYKGFKIVGSYKVEETTLIIEVGGKDGIYWLGVDSDDNGKVDSYQLFSEVKSGDTVTLKLWNGAAWDSYPMEDSILSALFGEGGLADQVLYNSFGFAENSLFSAPEKAGSLSKNGRSCTKYTSAFTFDGTALGGKKDMKAAEITLYVDKEYAFTVALDFAFTDEFKN